jgi:hypothetical protein
MASWKHQGAAISRRLACLGDCETHGEPATDEAAVMAELAWLLLPKAVKVLMALAMDVGGTVLLGIWLLVTLMKAGIL